MQSILEQITDWLKSMIISGIMGNLSGMFDSVNQQVGQIAGDVGTTPANFSPAVFSMIRNISESVILPIAGMVLTFIACYELIQMLIEHNNLANFETWTFFKWVFKTFLAVTLISNTFNITMAVFDVAQQVISRSGGLISGSTSVSDATLAAMQATLEGMDLGPLLGLYLQTFVVQVTMLALSAIIFVIVYGRMVEIYLMVSLAPIPFATFGNHEQSHTGQNYLRSLFALGFQGFLIMICVGIYAVLIFRTCLFRITLSAAFGALWAIRFCWHLRCLRREASRNPCLQRTKRGGMSHGILYFCAARPFKGQDQGLYEPDQTADSLLRSRCADWRSGFLFTQIQRESEPCRTWHDGGDAAAFLSCHV